MFTESSHFVHAPARRFVLPRETDFMRFRSAIQRQHHRLGLARALAPVGTNARDSLKIMFLALLDPLRSRSRWRGRPVSISLSHDGETATFATIGRTDLEVAREIFVNKEYDLPGASDEMTILDLGAHIGLASIYLASRYPNARIVAVEADPGLIDVLRKNVSDLPVQVIHAAVSAETGERSFFRSDDTWSNSVERTREWQDEITVPALTLSDICAQAGVDHVSLMKFDVEGAEWELLTDGIPEFIDAAIGEVHGDHRRDPRTIIDAVASTRCVSVRRSDRSRAVFFASNRCSRTREPLLGLVSHALLLL